MNGFEPLRRRIIDYTAAGQWSEVYDGPLENCESEKLKAENAKLREELDLCLKLAPECGGCEAMLDCYECLQADSSQKERKRLDYENEKLRELLWELFHCSRQVGCDCCETIYRRNCSVLDRIRELGIEVDV